MFDHKFTYKYNGFDPSAIQNRLTSDVFMGQSDHKKGGLHCAACQSLDFETLLRAIDPEAYLAFGRSLFAFS